MADTRDAIPNNLPAPLTSFVGREREIAELRRLLSGTRLLTLTGAGGCGKSRLGIEVAARVLTTFRDGVWVVELASLSDSSLLPHPVAAVLGVPEQPGRAVGDTLVDALRATSLLLVLDNCEHLLTGCAELANTLLRACPQVRILSTSREPLGVPGETIWRVPPLSMPDASTVLPADRLTTYEAIRLFVDRAASAQPGFQITVTNAPALARACRRLDGMPLAIELAAARVNALTVEQIASRLGDRFRLLTGGGRTTVPRRRTLRAAMDWSYDLLSETERALLPRLSVFAGGWTLEAAEAVCAEGEIAASEILELLAQLVDKSLVIAETRDAAARYRCAFTLDCWAGVAIRQGDYDRAASLYEESVALFREIGDTLEVPGPLSGLGLATAARGDAVRAIALLEESLTLARALRGSGAIASSLLRLGRVVFRQGSYARATALFRESITERKKRGDKDGIAACLNALAGVAVKERRLEQAARLFGAAEALREAIHTALPPAQRPEHDGHVAALRANLDETVLAATWAQGRAMEPDQAIDYALAPDTPRVSRARRASGCLDRAGTRGRTARRAGADEPRNRRPPRRRGADGRGTRAEHPQ